MTSSPTITDGQDTWSVVRPMVPIIGIRGDMGHGKDTLANTIRDCFPNYAIKKFAMKLRAAVQQLIDVPIEQLVSDADKQRSLAGSRWEVDVVKHRLFWMIKMVVGEVEDGAVHKWVESFYDILYELDESGRSVSVKFADQHNMTVGRLLQLLGTECFRTIIDNDVWVKSLLATWNRGGRPLTLVPDTRYPNESKAIRDAAGVVILVRRVCGSRADGRTTRHTSERALDDEPADIVLYNDGTLEDLRATFLAAWPKILSISAARMVL